MQATPKPMATRKPLNSSAKASASPTSVFRMTPGGRSATEGSAATLGLHLSQGQAVELDLEVDVASAVESVDLSRAAGQLQAVATWWMASPDPVRAGHA